MTLTDSNNTLVRVISAQSYSFNRANSQFHVLGSETVLTQSTGRAFQRSRIANGEAWEQMAYPSVVPGQAELQWQRNFTCVWIDARHDGAERHR